MKNRKTLNIRILKKIQNKVRFEIKEEKPGIPLYEIFQKNFEGKWNRVLSTTNVEKALHRKHNSYRFAIYNMGLAGFFKDRKRKREIQREKRLKKT